MQERLNKKLQSMSPKGSKAWFYREFIKGKIEGVTASYFDMMVSGTRTLRADVKEVIENFLKD